MMFEWDVTHKIATIGLRKITGYLRVIYYNYILI